MPVAVLAARRMSPLDSPVITSVADWLPELPPLDITSGMKNTSQVTASIVE